VQTEEMQKSVVTLLNVEQQRIWICDEHYRMHQAGNLVVVERRDQQVVLVDCREKEKSDRTQKLVSGRT
jgi:hypothetical protein